MSSSVVAIALAMGSAAHAQETASPTPITSANQSADPDIVVTGSAIRGVAPVGSNLISVGQETIEKTAPVNLSQLTNTVPSISTAGSIPQGENAFSYYSPQIHSLAGSSSNTTLVIVDGLRLPGGGQQFNQTDPNIIPVSAIQRVEVLADGASTAYGSDAVAGVVNYITKRTFDGFDMNIQQGFAKSYRNTAINAIWGTTWDSGGVYIAGSWSKQNTLLNREREFTSRGDYRSLGGSNNLSFTCPNATITVQQQGGLANSGIANRVFLGPQATTSVANSAANAPCNNSVYSTMVPGQGRGNVYMKVINDFSDKLSMQFTMNYNRQRTNSPGAPGTINGLAYGTGATGGANNRFPAQYNPFFLAPAGAPTTTIENVNVLALRADNDYGYTRTQADVIYATFQASYKINDKWTLTFSDAAGWNRSATDALNTFCGACANLALNGTTQNGNVNASAVSGQSVIALNLPLTTANAIDVWRPLNDPSNRTSAAVQRSLYSNDSGNTNLNQFNQMKLDLQGSLFELPGGDVRVAIGGEYYWQDQQQKFIGGNNTGPTTTGASYRNYEYKRDVKSFYGELYVPVVSPEMEIPFIYKFDLSIAGRYDKFSDVGDTTNPKFAANWEVVPGLKLRGNYSKAFVAPPIAVIGDPSQGYLYASGSVGTTGTINLPVSAFPNVINVPGARVVDANGNATATPCTAATQICNIGGGQAANGDAVGALRRQLGGGLVGVTPQRGRSWSVGVDLAPRFLPGFMGAVTFFHNTFIGGVSSPSPAAITASAGLRNLLTLCTQPTGCTADQINTFGNVANGSVIGSTVPLVTAYLIDQSVRNALDLKVEGIDASFSYRTQETGIGRFTVGTALTYFTKFRQAFAGAEDFSILNTSGYNTTFPSVQFKNRAQFGWEMGGFAADIFWNYTGSYRNWGSQSVAVITRDANGNPNGGGDYVSPNHVFDLHLQYTIGGDSIMKGWQVYADVQNLFDRDPPFYNGNVGGITGAGFGYNSFVSNPLGRIISIGARIKL
ncbi:TonB-dependent receptor domain-containing protein [Sphingobium sp. CR28]|uniref:TonB-dependent receptor domain-containing protein n=1 Tax=Sphingobium sp. CR28 TaxID=3400272 RepID=UPI003FF04097